MTEREPTEVVTECGRLADLAAEWWDLWRRCPLATPFTSPAWAIPWWRVFGPGRLATLAIRRHGRLVALAPLYLEHGPLGRRLLPIGIGASDYLDVLVDPALPDAPDLLVRAVATLEGWESWELEELPPDAAGMRLPLPDGCEETISDQSACPVLQLPVDGADPLSTVPPRQRRKIRMAHHRTDRRGGGIELAGQDGSAGFLASLVALHSARWQERGEEGILADERVRRFHAEALPRLATAGLLRATTLVIGEQVVAAYYGLQDSTRAYAYLGGFDPDFAFESPGTLLLADAVEAACRSGAREFHFLRGQEAYKYAWGAVDRWNRRRSFRRTEPA